MGENDSGSTLTLEEAVERKEVVEREAAPEPLFAAPPRQIRKRPSDEEAAKIVQRGTEIYEQKLRYQLTPKYAGLILVIATDTEEYAIGETVLAAADVILEKRPDAPLYGVRIGDDVLGRV